MVKMVRWIAVAFALVCALPASALNISYGDVDVRNLGAYGFTRTNSFLSLDSSGTDQLYQMFGYLGHGNDVISVTPGGGNFRVLSNIAATGPNTAQSTIGLGANGASRLGLNQTDIEIDYIFTLIDDSATPDGVGQGLTWDIQIRNITNTPLTLVFYSYLDLDLDGTAGNDTATSDLTRMVVTDNDTGTTFVWNASTPGANNFEVQTFPTVQATLNAMAGSAPQDLSDNIPNFGPSDFTGAYQYNFVVPGNSSFFLGGGAVVIPEPSTGLLTMLGLIGLSLQGRRRKA